MTNIPSLTIDLIRELKREYIDTMEIEEDIVGKPEYWKKAGVIELIRRLEAQARSIELKEIKA
jgi:hypothetical protein